MSYITLIQLIVMLFASSLFPQTTGTISQSKIDSLINYIKKDFFIPGIAVAVIHNHSVIIKKSYGFADLEEKIPVTDTTLFNIGSISKMLTAWGVMKLVQDGRLNLDEPAERYLLRWQFPPSEYDTRKVTISRLLSHTAGLSLSGYPGFESLDNLPTLEESLAGKTNGVGAVYLKAEPGLTYSYSGGGFTIIQLIIEEVTGQRFEDYMQENILKPLGMKYSTFTQKDKNEFRSKALPYNGDGQQIPDRKFRAVAAAGFQSTLTDMINLAKAELNFSGNSQVLTHESLLSMQQITAPAKSYGLGHQIRRYDGMAVVGHVGSNKGWTSHIEVIPATGDGIIILTNSNAGFFIHNILVCEWLKQTLNTTWQKEFCLSVPRSRFDFLRDDLDFLINNVEGKETEMEKLKSYLSLAEETFKQGDYSKTKSHLDAFKTLASETANNSTIDRLIYMSTLIINEIMYYYLN
ncbi:MAG: serine hydrolase [Aliifodinibius sp.]|nr:serine hydrolase [Fodinibius sp.]